MQPVSLACVIDGRLYSTEHAALIADDANWEGQNLEHPGRCTYLFRTPSGDYFALHRTAWQSERDWLESLSRGDALGLYADLPVRRLLLEDAFV